LTDVAVAITRAQSLLIVVGNPAILGLDGLWRSFLNFVYSQGGWRGSDGPPWDPTNNEVDADAENEHALELLHRITRRLEELVAVDDENDAENEGNPDRDWQTMLID
jgi:helicase MOV-10